VYAYVCCKYRIHIYGIYAYICSVYIYIYNSEKARRPKKTQRKREYIERTVALEGTGRRMYEALSY
jgi:hypothetical protein